MTNFITRLYRVVCVHGYTHTHSFHPSFYIEKDSQCDVRINDTYILSKAKNRFQISVTELFAKHISIKYFIVEVLTM